MRRSSLCLGNDMARDGVTDIAVTVPGYTAGRFILSEVAAIPNVGNSGKGLSVALADRGIIVVALSPGWVRTDMGGKGAPLSPAESVRGLRKVIEGLEPGDSGRFLNHDGTPIPW